MQDRGATRFKVAMWAIVVLIFAALVPPMVLSAAPLQCTRCHNDADFAAATHASGHAETPCVGCHAGTDVVSRFSFGVRQVYQMTVPLPVVPWAESSAIPDSRCAACHEDLSGIVNRNGMRISHDSCAVGRPCIDCHSGITHGQTADTWLRTASMDMCLECHTTRKVSSDCTTCHEGRREGEYIVEGAWAVTHGPEWESTHGMGNLSTCQACHPGSKCAQCHGAGVPHGLKFRSQHGDIAQTPEAYCKSCHQLSFCDDCHSGVKMPHPAAFTKTHADLVNKGGRTACLNCHDDPDCKGCHVAHIHPPGALATGGGSK